MKSKVLLTLFSVFAAVPFCSADVDLRLTGSTAFRAAVHAGLLNSFFASAPKYAHNETSGNLANAGKAIFQGTVNGISGTVTVRCGWSGSAGGIASVAAGSNVSFLETSTLPASAGEQAGQTTSVNMTAQIALSDVGQSATPTVSPVLQDIPVGVVPFTWVVNDTAATGSTVARYGFDNITAQFVRALYAAGSQPKSMLTGNAADADKTVFAVGRASSSGTRITMLAETKYGISVPVIQFNLTTSGDSITAVQSTGNNGYSSGGTIAVAMQSKSDATFDIKNSGGTTVATSPGGNIISCVGIADSDTVVAGGGARLKYEGVSYTGTDDDALIQNGLYTMWGYQHMLYNTLTTDEDSARAVLVEAIGANVGAAGLALDGMLVGRLEDGGVVGP